MSVSRGDIVQALFPFTDASGAKMDMAIANFRTLLPYSSFAIASANQWKCMTNRKLDMQ